MVEELLNKYDLYHSSVISGGKIKFNINYLPDGNVYISLVALINDEEKKETFDTVDDEYFKNYYLPNILQNGPGSNGDESARAHRRKCAEQGSDHQPSG